MDIVVLDGHALNPGDLSWQGLQALGVCTLHDRTPREEIVTRARHAEAVITNKAILDKAAIDSLEHLRYIGITATGTNVVDIGAATARGILVTNVPAYGTEAVAQSVFALLLELTNHVGHHDRTVHEGRWSASADFCYWDRPLIGLAGLTMGLVGYGNIAQAVACVAHAFGMKILASVRSAGKTPGLIPVELCDVDTLFAKADVVSMHCPLTPATAAMVDGRRLSLMKRGAYFINTARGPLVDEAALARALNEGIIAGAALDVLSIEPPAPENPLLTARNCIITPHIAWAVSSARKLLLDVTVANLQAFIKGQPVNVVNP